MPAAVSRQARTRTPGRVRDRMRASAQSSHVAGWATRITLRAGGPGRNGVGRKTGLACRFALAAERETARANAKEVLSVVAASFPTCRGENRQVGKLAATTLRTALVPALAS